jgi:hypothetical protein
LRPRAAREPAYALPLVLPFAPPDGAALLETPEGSAVVWFPAPGIAAARISGYATGDLARRAYEVTDLQPVVPHEGFLDLYDTTGFDWEARGRALKWNIVHLSPKMMLHMLVQTPPLLMATTVFKRALRDHVEVHTDKASFDSAYSLAVKRRTRATSHPPPR